MTAHKTGPGNVFNSKCPKLANKERERERDSQMMIESVLYDLVVTVYTGIQSHWICMYKIVESVLCADMNDFCFISTTKYI